MSMQVFPTAPSPTVTHLMNRDTLDAIAKAQGGRKKWAEVGRAENKRQGEELVLLLFGVVVAHWLLVEEEGSKRDREGSHAFSLLSQVPLTGSHSCLRGHLFPSLFFLSRCPGAASVSDNGLLGSGSSSVLLRMGSTILGLRTVWVI